MAGIKIGIGRVSTKEQNPQRQIDAFLKEGIEERYIFVDKCTGNGGNMDKREEYQRAKAVARKGDIVFLDALDRLGRNAKEIEQEWRYFTEEVECDVVVMNMPILDTRGRTEEDPTGELIAKLVLTIFAWMAQQETAERKRRQADGIAVAKREGKYNGRKPMDIDKYQFVSLYNEVKNGERTARYAMGQLGVKNTTWYKLVKEYESSTGRFEGEVRP